MPVVRRRKAVNITLSDRARAIAEVLANKDGTSVSQLLDAMLVSELVRGNRITESEVSVAIKTVKGRHKKEK